MKTLKIIICLLLMTSCSNSNQGSLSNQKKWAEDFNQLKQYIADQYPNLEDVTKEYELNLPGLSQSTLQQIEIATSEEQVLDVLKRFIKTFKDPHLRLVEEKKSDSENSEKEESAFSPKTSGVKACSKMGFQKRLHSYQFPTHSNFGFTQLENINNNFPSLILNTKSGKKFGFLRVASFHEPYYLDLCIDTWNSTMSSSPNSCDEECQEEFKRVTLHKKLIEAVRKNLLQLKKNKLDGLVVDVTFNGGGSDWVGAVMRMLTPKPLVCGSGGFTRSKHKESTFIEELDGLKEKIKNAASGAKKDEISRKIETTEKNIEETRKKCDRSNVWKNGNFPSCSIVKKEKAKDCSPGESYGFKKGIYSGKLFILANSKSASATEDLVARLQESKAATIIGETTYGAGCGYTDGGAKLYLNNSGLRLMVPDCIRYLRNGRNEVVGIKPDINMDMSTFRTPQFVESLIETLEKNL